METEHRTRTRNSVEDKNNDKRNLRNEADTIRGDQKKTRRYRYNESEEIIDKRNNDKRNLRNEADTIGGVQTKIKRY
jgi:hypothetical protein